MEKNLKNKIQALWTELETKKGTELNMLIGVDGFVDEIVHVVDKRQNFEQFTRLNTIEDFGKRVLTASGFSTNIEFVTQKMKLGGNGPIFANALLEYGVHLIYTGALGEEDIHPVFKPLAERSKAVYPLCDPGHTDAIEFEDGKLMLGKITELNKITWTRFKEVLGGAEKISKMIQECQLFGMENWTMVPHMSSIWEGIIQEVFPLLPTPAKKPLAFFDLADPEKRNKPDILYAMKLIKKFNEKFDAILGLNEKEVYEIADVFDIYVPETIPRLERLQTITMETYQKLGVYCLVVHPTKEAFAYVDGNFYQTEGPYCAKPLLTTGAGDNFNAGFCFGHSLGLNIQNSLLLGVATSGYYVRNAKSPSWEDLILFLKNWASDSL